MKGRVCQLPCGGTAQMQTTWPTVASEVLEAETQLFPAAEGVHTDLLPAARLSAPDSSL